MSSPRTRIGALLVAAVSALFIWWGWKQGAYFGGVFYPGALLVFLLLALMALMAPFDARLKGPALLAMWALLGLAAWTLLSTIWSPVPAAAIKDAQHAFLYLALFALGLWTTNLLGVRMLAALTPLAIAGAVIGVATVVVLASGVDVDWYFHDDATLRFPIGYRNANAAFFMICLWPLLALVSESDWRWELRALLVGAGTVLVELTFLSQSRGSVPAIALASLVFLAVSRNRLRAAVALVLVVGPALPAIPVLLDVYQHGNTDPGLIPLMRDAAGSIAITTALSLVIAAVALGGIVPRLDLNERTSSRIGGALAILAALGVLLGGSLFVARHGGPVDFVDQRLDEFTRIGYPDLSSQGIRYGTNVGSNRHDFWRVATQEGLDHPLLGGGGGSFEMAYLERRRSDETPEDPHSVEALMFSELGLPGLLLFGAFVVGAVGAGLRSRRLGPGAAALAAGSLAAGAQWLAQASFDWFWNYPGVTAPVFYMLGAAAAPALLDLRTRRGPRLRVFGAAGLLVLALVAVPLYLAGRYEQRAAEKSSSDPRGAIVDLDEAADLNPFEAEPLLVKGAIESRLGESELALAAFREAADREPRNYAAPYLIARELADSDPEEARDAIATARELNPKDPSVEVLWRQLSGEPEPEG
ncbi:MAG: O-antigen ligase family protein [Solirubrobacterales bacterium]